MSDRSARGGGQGDAGAQSPFREAARRLSVALPVAALGAVAVVAALWALALFLGPQERGSLDARVTAVGATVRCPICPEPIPLNDVQNTQALDMRRFIREQLQSGLSEDGVRQALVQRYGATILLSPPQQGFDLLAWLVPLAVIGACAAAVLVAVRRWSRQDQPVAVRLRTLSATADDPEGRRYEDLLDRELAARE